MICEGKFKDGMLIVWEGQDDFFIDVKKWIGKQMWVWGQIYIIEDFYEVCEKVDVQIICEVKDVMLYNIIGDVFVIYFKDGVQYCICCDFIVGCDGFYGLFC